MPSYQPRVLGNLSLVRNSAKTWADIKTLMTNLLSPPGNEYISNVRSQDQKCFEVCDVNDVYICGERIVQNITKNNNDTKTTYSDYANLYIINPNGINLLLGKTNPPLVITGILPEHIEIPQPPVAKVTSDKPTTTLGETQLFFGFSSKADYTLCNKEISAAKQTLNTTISDLNSKLKINSDELRSANAKIAAAKPKPRSTSTLRSTSRTRSKSKGKKPKGKKPKGKKATKKKAKKKKLKGKKAAAAAKPSPSPSPATIRKTATAAKPSPSPSPSPAKPATAAPKRTTATTKKPATRKKPATKNKK
jgi:hypothetical protein